jgi:hypothetical protein
LPVKGRGGHGREEEGAVLPERQGNHRDQAQENPGANTHEVECA